MTLHHDLRHSLKSPESPGSGKEPREWKRAQGVEKSPEKPRDPAPGAGASWQKPPQ